MRSVCAQVIEEGQKQFFGGLAVGVGKMKVSHVAHLSGALAGVLLVLLLHRLPSGNNQGSGAADKNA